MNTRHSLTVDLQGCVQHVTVAQNTHAAVYENVINKIAAQELACFEVIENHEWLSEVLAVAADIRKWAQTVVVVGIGGSDLGGRALIEALANKSEPLRVVFSGDTPDPAALFALRQALDLTTTAFVVVSKSGNTVEVLSAYLFWRHELETVLGDEWRARVIVITTPGSGKLWQEAQAESLQLLPHHEVGGRFAVLSSVGCLPAACAGADVVHYMTAAKNALHSKNFLTLAWQSAQTLYGLYQQGLPVAVLMPYSSRLTEFARWYRQLFAESLGKKAVGILPIQARGPADQHSQLQLYAEGTELASFWFLGVREAESDIVLPKSNSVLSSELSGLSMHWLLSAEMQATAESLISLGKPVTMLSIERVDEQALAELFVFFELVVVFLAELFDLDAFDQPGVEDSKKRLQQLLAKR